MFHLSVVPIWTHLSDKDGLTGGAHHFEFWSKAGIRTTQFDKTISDKWSQAEFMKLGNCVYVKVKVAFSVDAYLSNKIAATSALVLAPFESGKNLDVVNVNSFSDLQKTPAPKGWTPDPKEWTPAPDENIKAIWLTEPSTRTEFPPIATKTVYFVVTLLIGFVAAFLADKLIRYLLNNLLFALVAAGLFLAVLAPTTDGKNAHSELPYAYFEILRCVVCGASFYGAFKFKSRQGWLWTMVAAGVLFNPIVPAPFTRVAWQIIDVAAGTFFLFSISLFKKTLVSVVPPAVKAPSQA